MRRGTLLWIVLVSFVCATAGAQGVKVEGKGLDGKRVHVMKVDGKTPEVREKTPEVPKATESEKVAPLDVPRLEGLLTEFRDALYASEQEKLSAKITKLAKPHAADLLKLAGTVKKPNLDIVRLLGFARETTCSKFLMKLLGSTDASVRSAAVFALGISGDPKAVPRLTVLLHDPDAKVAVQSAIALGRIGDKKSYDALVARMKSKDPLQRIAAVKGLGLLGDERAVEQLEKRLVETDDPLEMTAVLDALNLIGGDNLYRILAQLEKMENVLLKHGTGRQTQLAQSAVTDALTRFIKEQEKKQGQGKGQGKGKGKRKTSGKGQGQGKSGSASGMGQGGQTPRANSDAGDVAATDSDLKSIERMTGVVWGNLPPAVQ